MSDTLEKLMKIISHSAGIPIHRINLDDTAKNLGLDSLDYLELIMEIEDEFGVDIPDPIAEEIQKGTIENIADYIEKELM